MLSRHRLKEVLKKFSRCHLAVLGDVMLDEFLWGKVDRISPEAPVPVVQIKKETWKPGGAANVASNLVALGAKATIFGVIGYDGSGRRLRETLERENIGTEGLIIDENRRTTVKTRIIGHTQQMIRIDREETEPFNTVIEKRLLSAIDNIFPKVQGIIVSDYAKGVITKNILRKIIKQFRDDGKFVAIDPKLKNFSLYRGASIITPNTKEAEAALGRSFENEESLLKGGLELLKQYNTDAVLITRGEQGMSLFEKGLKPLTIPTQALEVFDVTGAGDTVIATFSLAIASGCAMPTAAEIANLAAGVVVGIVGTATASPQSVLEHFDRVNLKTSETEG